MTDPQTNRTTTQKLTDFARTGVTLEAGVTLTLGMVLALAVNPVTGILAVALAAIARRATDKIGPITFEPGFLRLQQFARNRDTYFISAEPGFGAKIGAALSALVAGLVRTLEVASTGAQSVASSIYFTRVDGTLEFYVMNGLTGRPIALHEQGWTFVVPIDVLGGFVGFRQDSRQIYFLSYANAADGLWDIGSWVASNALPAEVTAIRRMPLRITAQNIGAVPVVIETAEGIGQLTIDLRDLSARGKIGVIDPSMTRRAITQSSAEVLGETASADAVVVTTPAGETRFVPEPQFGRALERAQAQI